MLAVYLLCGGRLELDHSLFFPDRAPGTRYTVPIPCVLVVHPRGRILFDTGIHRDAITDPVARFGEARARRFGVRSRPDEEVVSQLARLGLAPGDVDHVANSHFHFDHCGGNELFPRSTFLVQRAELEAARVADPARPGRYTPSFRDFDHPLRYEPLDGEHDVFGDGSAVLLPTPGHTPGHQSLRVRPGPGAGWVFTADACYTREHMDGDLLSGVVWDPDGMARSLRRLRALRDEDGASVMYGHDAAQWETLPQAPRPLLGG
jgi:glyoxylase-like metal-dependent hydrolase (beta-lactamase superfamily II)